MLLLKLKNGRLPAIFFTLFSACAASQAHEASWRVNAASSYGLISEAYWEGQELRTSAKSVAAYVDNALRADVEVAGWPFFVERRKLSTLTSNSNSLVLAAQESRAFSQGETGLYGAYLSLRSFTFDSVGTHFTQALNDEWSLKLSPRVVRLNAFKTGDGSETLTLGANEQHLQADLQQQSSSSFGITSNAYPLSLGTGPSLDARLDWQRGDWKASATAMNLWSRIPVKGAYFRKTVYDVSKAGKNFVYKDLPAVSGTYGQMDTSLALPRLITLEVAHQAAQSRWHNKLGTTWVDEKPIVWLATGYALGDHALEVTSHALNNAFFSYRVSNLLTRGLSVQLTLMVASNGKTDTALSQLSYRF